MCWQNKGSRLRVVTDGVSGPVNSPDAEGGRIIDKGTGEVYVRTEDSDDELLHVFEVPSTTHYLNAL